MKVLLVEDYQSFADLITEYLTDQGHRVTHVSTGAGAISLLDDFEFDAVVSDWELEWKGPDGGDILKHAAETWPTTITVAFSSLDRTPELRSRGIVVDHVLVKNEITKLGSVLAE